MMFRSVMEDFTNVLLVMVTMSDHRLLSTSTFSPVSDNHGNSYDGVAMRCVHTTGLPLVCPTLSFNTTRPAMYGVLGKPLLLDCTVPGSQDLVFKWKKGATFVSSNVTLWLQSYSDDDSGTYSCSVSSRHSTCSGQADVAHFNVITAGECNCAITLHHKHCMMVSGV